MKKITFQLISIYTLILSCSSDDNNTSTSNICENNPLENIEWLKDIVDTQNNPLINTIAVEIKQYKYNGNTTAFWINYCASPECIPFEIIIYDCNMNTICHSTDAIDINATTPNCTNFFATATFQKIVFSTSTTINGN